MAETSRASSAICTYTNDAIYVRDKSLVDELIGEVTFTQMMFFQIMARLPSPTEVKIVDAVLVTLLEHGITPSAMLPSSGASSAGRCQTSPSTSCTWAVSCARSSSTASDAFGAAPCVDMSGPPRWSANARLCSAQCGLKRSGNAACV